jgi:hypothetical protein
MQVIVFMAAFPRFASDSTNRRGTPIPPNALKGEPRAQNARTRGMNAMTHDGNRNRSLRTNHAEFDRDEWEQDGRRERDARNKRALDDKLELGLEESFPASDPVAVIQPRRSSPQQRKR